MKRFAAIALALLLTASVPALAAEGTAASAAVEVNAPSAVLMEKVTGTVLYGPLFAGYVVTALPLIVLFLCLMNSFIEGLTAGAVKA